MSKVEFENYCKLYEQLLKELVDLHNGHLSFKIQIGRGSGTKLRRTLKNIRNLSKEIYLSSLEVYKENMGNNAERWAKERERKALLKAKRQKIMLEAREKRYKNGKNNDTDQNSI